MVIFLNVICFRRHSVELTKLVANDIQEHVSRDRQECKVDFPKLYREVIDQGGLETENITEEDIGQYIHDKTCKKIKDLTFGIEETNGIWVAKEALHPGYHMQHPQEILVCTFTLLLLVDLMENGYSDWGLHYNSVWASCSLIFNHVWPSTMARLYTFIFSGKKFKEFIISESC